MFNRFLATNAVILLAVLGGKSTAVAAPTPARHAVTATGQVLCDARGCRPVKSGCRLEYRTGIAGGAVPTGGNVEICPRQSAR